MGGGGVKSEFGSERYAAMGVVGHKCRFRMRTGSAGLRRIRRGGVCCVRVMR